MIDRYQDPNIIQEKLKQPIHLRQQVSKSLLAKFPQYKDLFHKCPGCNRYSLKPRMNPNLYTPQSVKNCKERKCAMPDCQYIHNGEEISKGGQLDEYSY